ncbi:unnamed protein product [Phytomonas sp. Hart1]|nr:unnamed protein product [Phytomonas sp. Hart1]|eukprot:CCW69110.1 unnamed protein product [Phytomonas sp. isolate Hart1]
MKSILSITFLFLIVIPVLVKSNKNGEDLPRGVIRGPLLHEHSLQSPLVHDWWEEGIPHFMIGGSAIASTNFIRLTSNNLDDHGFAFNTAPMDHDNWEARIKFSVRPPVPALRSNASGIAYQGGDGIAIWYLQQPIGDDHQHVLKYSKPITREIDLEMRDKEDPWRIVDTILNTNEEEFDDYAGLPDEDLTEEEKKKRDSANERRELKQTQRNALFRKIFKRGASVDDTDREPRIMGVRYSDFCKGFAIVLDSVGDEYEHKEKGDAIRHHHKSSISLLLNLPDHTTESSTAIHNNFDGTQLNFRKFSPILRCEYDFRQLPIGSYASKKDVDKETLALNAHEEPAELIIRYYEKKLSIIIQREDITKRKIIRAANRNMANKAETIDIHRTYKETLCGEVFPVNIPLGYHFGISASTGHLEDHQAHEKEEGIFYQHKNDSLTHVDIHDIHRIEFRELGTDPREMGYTKSVPIERFNYEGDQRERQHFSRQIPVRPDAEVP